VRFAASDFRRDSRRLRLGARRLSSGLVNGVHIVLGSLSILLSVLAALWGGWCWRQSRPSRLFWGLLRGAQATIVVEAAIGGVLLAMGRKVSGLHEIYGLLPLAVSFIGEQLRISAAQMILDARGYESAQAVGQLPVAEQREIVSAIVRREIGVMALAAAVIVVLLVRAATVVH
jgi:hypothetical protein